MDFDSPLPFLVESNKPYFELEAIKIRKVIRVLNAEQLQKIMKMSPNLARQTVDLYAADNPPSKPALWTYVGDVYRGLQSATMTREDNDWAQSHLVIASGLYGLLRPYDAISPYRLEMQAKLAIDKSVNLYDYWSQKLADYIESTHSKTIVVLSSEEYARAAISKLPTEIKVITPRFFDHKPNGQVGQVPIYNKQMRGVMARWMIDNRVEDAALLKNFIKHGYIYDAERSLPGSPAFTRKTMRPLDLPSKVGLQSVRSPAKL